MTALACTSNDIISGYHDLFWASAADTSTFVALGRTGPDGFRRIVEYNVKELTGDALGPETVIDGIYQGGNCTLEFTLQDLGRDAVKNFLAQFPTLGPVATTDINKVGTPGVPLSCTRGGYLKATPTLGTPANTVHGATSGQVYFGYHINPLTFNLDTNERFVPIVFRCLPYLNGSSQRVWWDWSASAS